MTDDAMTLTERRKYLTKMQSRYRGANRGERSRLLTESETLRAALNAVAFAEPDWPRHHTPPDRFTRYHYRIEEYRLPKGKEAHQAYGETVGADGMSLLTALFAPATPPMLRSLPAVDLPRRVWLYQYVVWEGQIRFRDPKEMPAIALRMDTSYEPEARYGEKRGMGWTGYKVHLTETCEDDLPHLLTQVEITVATETDVTHLAVIHRELARTGRLRAAPRGCRLHPCPQSRGEPCATWC